MKSIFKNIYIYKNKN